MPTADPPGPTGRVGGQPARRALARLAPVVAVVALALASAGCGSDATLARQEAQARAFTCASLQERHINAPVRIPPWRFFLHGAAERADGQKTKKARQAQNATQIKADCAAATNRGLLRP